MDGRRRGHRDRHDECSGEALRDEVEWLLHAFAEHYREWRDGVLGRALVAQHEEERGSEVVRMAREAVAQAREALYRAQAALDELNG